MPWVSGKALLLPMCMEHSPGLPFLGDARHALERVLSRYTARGWGVQAATELEFYLIDDAPVTPLAERMRVGGDILGLRTLEAHDAFLTDLQAGAAAMGIRTETVTSESGSGQFEVTLAHGDALRTADDTWLFKMLARGIAHQHGMVATFMAKPYPQDAGTGMHVHFSAIDGDGRNVFDDGTAEGNETLRHAVAGCLDAMADATLIFAPHENSYHRLVPGAHAPTAVCWGYENRTAAIRIPAGPGSARRIEHRVAGGDINPYLLFAAILGAAIEGIEAESAPPAPVTGNAYEAEAPALAASWPDAVERFAESPIMKRIFPAELIEQLVLTKWQELRRLAEMDEAEIRLLYLDRV